MSEKGKWLSIGEVAKRAGVSVQTVRHYGKLGLVQPSAVTDAGYRLYSEADLAKLELVRTLRAVGFDLDTITQLLMARISATDAVNLQLEALDLQTRALQRQQVILRAVAKGSEPAVLSRLRRLDVLARLDKLEREAFLADQLQASFAGKPTSPEVWGAATAEFPEDMDEAQLEAWLELAEIASDPEVLETLRRQGEPFAGLDQDAPAMQAWNAAQQSFMAEAMDLMQQNRSAEDDATQALIDRWVKSFAQVMQREPDAAFAQWMLDYFESAHHPKINRYWELIAQLKQMPYSPAFVNAFDWLLTGLRFKSTPHQNLQDKAGHAPTQPPPSNG
jgi:DNA-binding transcriptional MerR regulator